VSVIGNADIEWSPPIRPDVLVGRPRPRRRSPVTASATRRGPSRPGWLRTRPGSCGPWSDGPAHQQDIHRAPHMRRRGRPARS